MAATTLLTWQPAAAWHWLAHSTLWGLVLTLAAYGLGRWLYARTGWAVLQPVVVAIVAIIAILATTGISYEQYFASSQFIHFLLGPATVALALPLHAQLPRLKATLLPLSIGVGVGAVVSAVSAIVLTAQTGGDRQLQITMAPKAATTPVSIAIAEQLGGLPSLTAVVTVLAGISGAMFGPWVLDRLRISDAAARGVAIGAASHGLGTSRALLESETAGAFSAVSMGLSALATSVVVPLVLLVL